MADSGINIISELVAMYSIDAPAMVREMRAAVAAGEPERVAREAHGLKGSSANLGAEILSERCHALETLTRAHREGAQTQIDEIDAELEVVLAALATLPEVAREKSQA